MYVIKSLNQNKMKAKEKAKELVEKYANTNGVYGASKQCALIAVDEIMKISTLGRSHNRDESQYDYWQEVKEEINNL